MNWRSQLILDEDIGIKGLFQQYTAGQPLAGDPITIVTIADRFTLPAKASPEKLPMVSFGYGGSRPFQGGTTEGAREEVVIVVHATVDATNEKGLIERAGDMDTCVRRIAKALRAQSFDNVFIESTSVSVETTGGMLSDKERLLFEISLIVEVYAE